VAIARALVQDPPLVIADEPTAHLDSIQVEGVLRIIGDIAGSGRLVVVATHDARISQLADQVVQLVRQGPEPPATPVHVTLAAGEVLFRQGDPSDLVYVVLSGAIDIVRELANGDEELLTRLGPGDYFGELGPILSLPRSATARAGAECELRGYGVHEFRARFR
jgi:putative ABC transport system ATP-binding protein